jgi:hypothetical protein
MTRSLGGEFFDCLENTQVRRRYNAAEEFGEDRSLMRAAVFGDGSSSLAPCRFAA